MFKWLMIIGVIMMTGVFSIRAEVTMNAVGDFDLNRFLGTWYEVARLPAVFEKDLIEVTATYSLKPNGMVKVENRGTNSRSHKPKTAIGKAKVAGKSDVGYLRVSFFGPFYADYKIIVLDADYRYAMVASSMKYLWILSRTPVMEKSVLEDLVEKARQNGFATGTLFYTPQK